MKHFFADPDLGLIGLLFFFTFFCVVTLWTFRPSAKKQYTDHGKIPLKEGIGEHNK
jgi:cbb3-type cytochrome oxidase subunit 3